ncbi:hypothetical protein GX51_04101 [Blastomyces parvus]|uniref:Uncharacterized protein n=1 Tax=Blastomyces parvus TaxID=2060905 RepID=A0A2B7X3E2_9EURO|nr:hypothetical protein GX51_04101 [Blastomyces parvus]
MGQPRRTGNTPPNSSCSVQANSDSSDRSEVRGSTAEGVHYWSLPSLPQALRLEERITDERENNGRCHIYNSENVFRWEADVGSRCQTDFGAPVSISLEDIQDHHADRGTGPARTDRARGAGLTTTGTRHPALWYVSDDSYLYAPPRPNGYLDNGVGNEAEPENPRTPTDTRTNQVNGSPDSTRPNPSEGSPDGSVLNMPQNGGQGQVLGNTPDGQDDGNYIWEEPFIPSGIHIPQVESQGVLGSMLNNQTNGNGGLANHSVNSGFSDESSSDDDDGEYNPRR